MAIKILGMSDSIMSITGFATITKELFKRLSKHPDFEVYNISQGHIGKDIKNAKFLDGEDIDFPILQSGMQPYATEFLRPYLNKYNPDILFCLWDTFMLKQSNYDNIDLAPSKFVMYWPSDGSYLPATCETILAKSYAPVAMSKHGLRQIKWLYEKGYIAYDIFKKATYIPHAIDEKIYYPLTPDLKLSARDRFGIPRNVFVIGTVARNQGRKMMDRTIKSFAMFSKDKPDVRLLLHSDPNDMAAASNLKNLILRYDKQYPGVASKVLWSGIKFYKGFSYDDMRELYNVMDINLLTTSGEGFGIPIIEAMACGVPTVATAYTTSPELLIEDGKVGELIKLAGEPEIDYDHVDFNDYDKVYAPTHELGLNSITGTWDVERGICDVYDCAEKLNKLYKNRTYLAELSSKCRDKAVKYYSWDKVVFPQWLDFFRRVYQS